MKIKIVKTQIVETVTKRVMFPNGFVFNYTLTSVNGAAPTFNLDTVMYKGKSYQHYIVDEQQVIIKEIAFNDTRNIIKHCTAINKLITCEKDISLFNSFEYLFKGQLGNLEFLTDHNNIILNPILPVNSVYLYQDYSYDNKEELQLIVDWIKDNSDKVEIKGKLEVSEVPYYNQNDTNNLHCLSGEIIVHDNTLLDYYYVNNQSYFSLTEGMSKLFKHILKLATKHQDTLVLARNFASPLIIQRAKDIISIHNHIDSFKTTALSDFTSSCLSLNDITNPAAYNAILTHINLDIATIQDLICLTILELIKNNGEIT